MRKSLLFSASALLISASAGCTVSPAPPGEPTSCPADGFEGNDTEATAFELPEMTDHPDSSRDVLALSVHVTDDEDWFKVHVKDTGLGGNPIVSVAVSSADFELQTWFLCDDERRGETDCQYGADAYETVGDLRSSARGCRGDALEPARTVGGSTQLDTGVLAESVTECSGTSSDDGTLFIRVRQRGGSRPVSSLACSYELRVFVQ